MEENWKYFKPGDIIRDGEDSIWGKKLFEITSFHGNAYLPLATGYFLGKEKNIANMCNLDIRNIKLISSKRRPLRRINKKALIVMMNKGVLEARREFFMRINTKTL